MGILRVVVCTMGRISTFRSYQLILLLAAALAVVAFYYFGSERQNFSSTTKRIKQSQASHNANRNDADLTLDTRLTPHEHDGGEDGGEGGEDTSSLSDPHFHVLMMFTKIDKSRSLQEKFRVAMLSMVKHGDFLEEEVLVLHFVSDQASQELGQRMLQEVLLDATFQYEVVFHDVVDLTHKLFPIVEAMQKHFSAGSGAYYSDAIFFLSVAMHHIMPQSLSRIVQVDLDLKYRTNIRDLFKQFDHFPPGAVLGITREMQPVYRYAQFPHVNHLTSLVLMSGEPPPDGLPGFNSGVMLLDLKAMRASALYNQLPGARERGQAGGPVPSSTPWACGWNRQLCTWWREHGYGDVFQLYYRCDGPVYIFHGNCNTGHPG
uniref:Xyloside xylosyltransferase 1 n=1 Tax=Gadus morhua TaxID=8049 RepID=A0A8C4ZQG5_GADMO